jgi:hypothetical protein
MAAYEVFARGAGLGDFLAGFFTFAAAAHR